MATLKRKTLKKKVEKKEIEAGGNSYVLEDGGYNPFGKYATLRTSPKVKNSYVRVESYKELKKGNKLEGLQQVIFMDRYAMRDETGKQLEEYPEQMWLRTSRAIASLEKTDALKKKWEKEFIYAQQGLKFVPAGSTLSGAGTGSLVTYYNCYVIPSPEDSRTGIIDNLKVMAEIMARRGGVGINLSTLRPKGSYIKTVNGFSSGPCNWAQLYSITNGEIITQNGSRHGALMLMIDDDHPDIEEFITCKQTPGWLTHANLSICVSDAFMDAVKNDGDWDLKWGGKVYKTVKASYLWNLICHSAWASAEPGLVFTDRYNTESNTWYYENIRCVNPCGEQGLPEWNVCNLGSINLSAFVNEEGIFDYDELIKITKIAMRFMDNVIDANYYFFKEIEDNQMRTRRTGLGTMGLADALIKMKLRYSSDSAMEVVDKIYSTMRNAAYEASVDLAIEKGAFTMFDKEKYMKGKFIQRLPKELQTRIAKHGIRNAVLLSQAPTGTISLYAGVSSGIEPVYAFGHQRTDATGSHTVYHPLFEAWKRSAGENVPIPDYFVSAADLSPEEHVKMQAVIQKYTDASISKTVNTPAGYSVEDIKEIYIKAYDMGCKGVTVYREGSRDAVLETLKSDKDVKEEVVIDKISLKPRPDQLQGMTYKTKTPVGNAYVTINNDESGNIYEVFINIGKAGSDIAADAVAIGKLISLTFSIPTNYSSRELTNEIIKKLEGIGGSNSVGMGVKRVKSLADALAKVLAEHMGLSKETKIEEVVGSQNEIHFDICPECGNASLVREEGCQKCYTCGFSKC